MRKPPADRLGFEDAAFLNFERPEFPYNVGSVGIFEGAIPFQKYVQHVETRIQLVPRYCQRVVTVPFNVAQPTWQDDPHFDVHNHIERVRLPEPADDAQLARFAGEFFSTQLDRSRPLWEVRLVEGLSGGRTAQVAKVHHCMVDGVAGVGLLAALFDFSPKGRTERRQRREQPEALPGRLTLLTDAVFDQIGEQLSTVESLTAAVINPLASLGWLRSVAGSFWAARSYLARPAESMPWKRPLSQPRRLAWVRLPFADVKEISSGWGGTINDAALTILAGALARYLEYHGQQTAGVVVRVLIPVNVRRAAEEEALGNRVSFMLAGLPLEVREPRERFRRIHDEIASLKAQGQAAGLDQFMQALGKIPAPVQPLFSGALTLPNNLAHFVCTNVPGPRQPLYCVGHQMIEHYPWVPIAWRMGMAVAVMSYDQSLSLSLTADREVMYDLDRLAGFIEESFAETHAAAVKPRRRRSRLTTRDTKAHEVRPEATTGNGAAAERVRK
jgi:WS/DGAT/MGAT family acyltransferase